jgi:hypothetical protein
MANYTCHYFQRLGYSDDGLGLGYARGRVEQCILMGRINWHILRDLMSQIRSCQRYSIVQEINYGIRGASVDQDAGDRDHAQGDPCPRGPRGSACEGCSSDREIAGANRDQQ